MKTTRGETRAESVSRARYEEALALMPAPGTGCHVALLGAANLGCLAGVAEDRVFSDIRAAVPGGGRMVPDREIRDAVAKAFAECDSLAWRGRAEQARTRGRKPRPFDGEAYRQVLVRQGDGAGEVDLWELSPLRLDLPPGPEDAVALLDRLYRPSEHLFIGDTYGGGDCVRTAAEHRRRIGRDGLCPPHILPNPLTGKVHRSRTGRPSRRCDEAVADHRFALVEFDTLARADQLAFWYSVLYKELLPVSAIVDSGNKSLHAWIRADLPNAEAWDRCVREGMYGRETGRMTLLGADRANQNPSRLSRLPGHRRDNGRIQRLLYLNPDAGRQQG